MIDTIDFGQTKIMLVTVVQLTIKIFDFWIQKSFGPEMSIFLLFLDPEITPFLYFLDLVIFWSIIPISGSRNCSFSEKCHTQNFYLSCFKSDFDAVKSKFGLLIE